MKTQIKTWLRAVAVFAICGILSWPVAAADGELIDLKWADLIPPGQALSDDFDVLINPGEPPLFSDPMEDSAPYTPVVTEYEGKRVRIAGFVVPLDFIGKGTKQFLLVPYFGACIHVPPPPPNQIVFVTTEEPYKIQGLFQAVYVSGKFGLATVTTDLAESGYTLLAEDIVPYVIER